MKKDFTYFSTYIIILGVFGRVGECPLLLLLQWCVKYSPRRNICQDMVPYGPYFWLPLRCFCISNKVDIWLMLALYAWTSFQTLTAILGLCTNCKWPRMTLQDTIKVIRAGGLRQRCSDCIFVQASMLLPVFSVLRVEFVIYSVSGYHELWISQSIILMLKKAPLGKALLKSLMEYLLMSFSTESNFSK